MPRKDDDQDREIRGVVNLCSFQNDLNVQRCDIFTVLLRFKSRCQKGTLGRKSVFEDVTILVSLFLLCYFQLHEVQYLCSHENTHVFEENTASSAHAVRMISVHYGHWSNPCVHLPRYQLQCPFKCFNLSYNFYTELSITKKFHVST